MPSVERMIELFGGQHLYGHDPLVPLREPLQNASDAVRAGRVVEEDQAHSGRIDLKPEPIEGEDAYRFTVRDNGFGMSCFVLTGPLLEFGKRFWTSAEAQHEDPGLLARKLSQTGRYGIGFFSTFMIPKDVMVTSRRFDGEGVPYELRFTAEAGLRPVLLEATHADLKTASTVIGLRLDQGTYDAWHVMRHPASYRADLTLTFEQRVAMLCPALDCDAFVNGKRPN